MNDIPDRVLNGLRARVQTWERDHDLDPMEAAIALELVASEREVAASRAQSSDDGGEAAQQPIADGSGEITSQQAWDHFKRTGVILPGHADTIAARRADQIKRGEEVTRVGGEADD